MVKRERLSMDWKELREARLVGIPEQIIGKMMPGFELSEKEKELIKSKGKVYVLGYMKDGKWIKHQLRDLPGGSRLKVTMHNNSKKEEIKKIEYVIDRLIDSEPIGDGSYYDRDRAIKFLNERKSEFIIEDDVTYKEFLDMYDISDISDQIAFSWGREGYRVNNDFYYIDINRKYIRPII